MKWQDDSEVLAGLVLTNRLSSTAVRPEIFWGEYENMIKLIKQGVTEPEELTSKIGFGPVQAAIEASKSVNGLGNMDWVSILETSHAEYTAGVQLEKMGRKLQKGDGADWAILNKISSKAQEGIGGDFIPLSEIEGSTIPFIESGWKTFDDHIGGIPETGLIVVGGNPGVGKTWFMTNFCSRFANHHKDKQIAVFTIEMIGKELALRFRAEKLKTSVEKRILINDIPVTQDEVINKASTIENLGLIVIDFADLMIQGETNESSMSNIYRTLMIGAKQLQCPIMLLAQLSRYKGGIPKPNHLRWTGLAEAFAWLLLMLYNKSTDWHAEAEEGDHILPSQEDMAFIIAWKSRGGFRGKKSDGGPGAIRLQFKGNMGWHPTEGRWFSLKRL